MFLQIAKDQRPAARQTWQVCARTPIHLGPGVRLLGKMPDIRGLYVAGAL